MAASTLMLSFFFVAVICVGSGAAVEGRGAKRFT